MRKKCAVITLCICAAIGVLHIADLVLYTDLITGFNTYGSVAIRYIVLFVGALICALPLLYKKGSIHTPPIGKAHCVCLAACGIVSEIYGFFNVLKFTFSGSGALAFARGALFVVFGVFCFIAALRIKTSNYSGQAVMFIGVIGSLSLYLLTIERFIGRASSLYRFAPTLGVLSALAALAFSTQLIKMVCLDEEHRNYNMLATTGQISFLLCTCMELPHSIYLFAMGLAPLNDVMLCLLLGILGLIGALYAISVAEA